MLFSRLLTSVAFSLAFASSALAAPSDAAARYLSLEPVVELLKAPTVSANPVKRLTNGERLARGLPLNPPVRRSPGQLRVRQSPTPTSDTPSSTSDSASSTPTPPPTSGSSSASSSTATPPPSSASSASSSSSSSSASASSSSSTPSATPTCTVSGTIAWSFFNVITSQQMSGFVSKTLNTYGLYSLTTESSAALQVCYKPSDTGPSGPVTFIATNGDADHPYVAAVADTGDDLDPSTTGHWAFVAGASASAPVPVGPAQPAPNTYAASTTGDVETTVWTIGADGTIGASWVNTNGATLPAYIVWDIYVGGWVLTADQPETTSPRGPGFASTWTFVPSATVAAP